MRRVDVESELPDQSSKLMSHLPVILVAMAGEEEVSEPREQILHALDPSGDMATMLATLGKVGKAPTWLNRFGGAKWNEIIGLVGQQGELLDDIVEALRVLGPRGWSIDAMNADKLAEALMLVRDGRADEADDLLAWLWDDDWPIKKVPLHIGLLGYDDPELRAIASERRRLIEKALTHHRNGAFEASIPIVLAQIEGIVVDAANSKTFFSRSRTKRADVVDPTNIATIEAALGVVRQVFTESVEETRASGGLSRHGILHGRELAYDTKVVSAKCWSLLFAVVQWAGPRLEEEALRRREARQAAAAGSNATDENGRRIDDREFAETCRMLDVLTTSAMGWHGQRGRYRDDLIGGVYDTEDFQERGLPSEQGTHCEVSEDGQACWFWRHTISGWVLGYALTCDDGQHMEHWYYAGPDAPAGSPLEHPEAWGGDAWQEPPDWTH